MVFEICITNLIIFTWKNNAYFTKPMHLLLEWYSTIFSTGNEFHYQNYITARTDSGIQWKKKWSHFDLKSWVTSGTKIRPGIPSNWKIFESNWLSILQLLGILGRILVHPMTQLFRSKWLHFFVQCLAFSSWRASCQNPSTWHQSVSLWSLEQIKTEKAKLTPSKALLWRRIAMCLRSGASVSIL